MLALNISIALIVLFNTLFVKEVLDMSFFPTLLLFTTIFRISLNVSSTRLILTTGNPGNVVQTFGPVSYTHLDVYKRQAGMSEKENTQSTPAAQPTPAPQPQPQMAAQQPMMGQPMMGQPMMGQPMMGQSMMGQEMSQMYGQQQVNVQPAQFQAFTGAVPGNFQPENIDLIMDVPLEVTDVYKRQMLYRQPDRLEFAQL